MVDRSAQAPAAAFDAWAPGCVLFLGADPDVDTGEEQAARAAGLDTARRVEDVAPHRRVVVRPGPAGLELAGFAALERAFRARGPGGPRLATPATDVARAARVAGWLDTLRDLTPEARLVPAALAHRVGLAQERLGWDAARLTDDFGRPRAGLTADGVLWRGRDDPAGPATRRFGLWHQHVWTDDPVGAASTDADIPHPDDAARRLAWRVARRFWHPFFAVTVGPCGEAPDSPWRLLGLTDGQLAGPAGCGLDPAGFYRHLAEGLDPRRAALAAAEAASRPAPPAS